MSSFCRRSSTAFVVAVTIASLLVTGAPADAKPGFTFERIAGPDRYDTARQLAKASFPSGSSGAVLASGERFPDALAGSFLAGSGNGPVLLTQSGSLSGAAKLALSELKVRNVALLGGPLAVSTLVENELKGTDSTAPGGGKLNVVRIAGADRYETARLIATAAGTTPAPVNGVRTVLIATGEAFPDALAGGPLAFASKLPVVLTTRDALHPQAKQALEALNAKQAIILGGVAAVSAATEDQIRATGGITTVRLAGADRTDTATKVADYAIANLGFSTTHVNLARGDDFADALGGGSHGGVEKAPILLTQTPTDLGAPTRAYLTKQSTTLTNGHIFGGVNAVSDAVKTEAETAARGTAPVDTTAPSMSTATGSAASGAVTVTYSETVTCSNDAATRQQFAFAGASPTVPSAISCSGATVTLTFTAVSGSGNLTYTDEAAASDANDVKDTAGNPATSPQTINVTVTGGGGGPDTTAPRILTATANPANDTVQLLYSEAVVCTDDAATRAQFAFAGATSGQPNSVLCNDSTTVTLLFTDVTSAGTLTYNDEAPTAADANDVRDRSGNSAVSPQQLQALIGGSDTTAPSMITATANTSAETVTVTYSEAVTCTDSAATRAQFGYTGSSASNPTAISCNNTATVTLTFADVTGPGNLTYTDESPSSDANDVRDLAGNAATSPQNQAVQAGVDTTRPSMVSARANPTARVVLVTYSEGVRCSDLSGTRAQFNYSNGQPSTPASVQCDGSSTVTLLFDGISGSGSGTLVYNDESGAADANDVLDASGNQAASPQTASVTTVNDVSRPRIQEVTANITAEVLIVTYSEPVTCTINSADTLGRAQFTYDGAASQVPVAVSCGDTREVTLRFDNVTGGGTLRYNDDNPASLDGNDVRDLSGNQAESPQTVAAVTSTDTARPMMVSAVANSQSEQVIVTYNEPVMCNKEPPPPNDHFSYSMAAPPQPTEVICGDRPSTTVTLKFGNVTGAGNLTYTDTTPGGPAGDITDAFGNSATSPQTIAATASIDATPPAMVSAVASTTADTVTITYNKAVLCNDSQTLRLYYGYTGASPANPSSVACNGTTLVVLRFDDVTGPGLLTYTDRTPDASERDVKDTSGNSAASPQTVAVT